MSNYTSAHALPYPAETDVPDGAAQIQTLASALDGTLSFYGSAPPGAPTIGTLWWNTAGAGGAGQLEVYNGTQWEVVYATNPPSFSGHLSTVASIPNNAWTTLNLDTVDADNYNGWNTTSSLYYPQVAGWYQAQTLVSFSANTTGDRGAGVAWSATSPNTPGDQILARAANGEAVLQLGTRLVYCAGGSYIRFMAFQNSGAALATYASGVYCTATWLHP